MKMLSGGCIRNKPKEGSDLTEKPTGTKLSMVSKKKRKRKRTKACFICGCWPQLFMKDV